MAASSIPPETPPANHLQRLLLRRIISEAPPQALLAQGAQGSALPQEIVYTTNKEETTKQKEQGGIGFGFSGVRVILGVQCWHAVSLPLQINTITESIDGSSVEHMVWRRIWSRERKAEVEGREDDVKV